MPKSRCTTPSAGPPVTAQATTAATTATPASSRTPLRRGFPVVITSGKPRRRGVRLLAGVAVVAAVVACAVTGGPALGVVHLLFGILAFAAVAGTAVFAY